MNRKEFVAHKGMDNKFNICLRDQDRNKQNIYNQQIRADVIKYSSNERVLTKYTTPGLEQGQAELLIAEADIKAQFPAVELDIALNSLRPARNSLLAETDYLALSDVTMSDDMKTYRQNLRDITKGLDTVDKVNKVTMPTKPE